MLRAVIFDCDGVLVDTAQLWLLARQRVLKNHRIHVSPAWLRSKFGMTLDLQYADLLNVSTSDPFLQQLLRETNRVAINLVRTHAPLLPGVKSLLQFLKRSHIQCAVASMTTREILDSLLMRHRLTNYFTVTHTVEHTSHGKPHPEIYLKTLKALRVRSSDSIVIEDSQFGVEAAKRARIRCVGLARSQSARLALHKADVIVSSLDETKHYLQSPVVQ